MRSRLLVPAPARVTEEDAKAAHEREVQELKQENGRLVARLKRDIERAEKAGVMSEARARKMAATIHRLIDVERRLEDPLRRWSPVTQDDLLARLRLMAPGAGLVMPGERDFDAVSPAGVILP